MDIMEKNVSNLNELERFKLISQLEIDKET
jgi:hypothetical protein